AVEPQEDDPIDAEEGAANRGDSTATVSNEDNLDGFIVDDDESADEWHSKAKPRKRGRAEPGFYISKRKHIAGKYYVLFAKGKFDYSSFKSKEEAAGFDPLGLMQISRPNTGTSGYDMSTRDLRSKYRLACSCEVLKSLSSQESSQSPMEAVKETNKDVAKLWEESYDNTYFFEQKSGLAPRRVRVALVNGPVLHILPALERAVQFRSDKDKSLKIMRAWVGSRRIVGVRFPHDDDATQKLQEELDKIIKARKDAGTSYSDEDMEPMCAKSQKWATAERKTMKSFFAVKSAPAGGKLNNSSNKKPATASTTTKRSAPSSSSSSAKKKTKSMMSFFSVKKKKTDENKKALSPPEEIDLTDD
ncbi:MAG: hypothetical protein SGARI_002896, partial [Bacillariaceae sp.]